MHNCVFQRASINALERFLLVSSELGVDICWLGHLEVQIEVGLPKDYVVFQLPGQLGVGSGVLLLAQEGVLLHLRFRISIFQVVRNRGQLVRELVVGDPVLPADYLSRKDLVVGVLLLLLCLLLLSLLLL